MRGNSGVDIIADTGGRDTLVLSAYSFPELIKGRSYLDVDKDGKIDSQQHQLGSPQQGVIIVGMYDDTRSKPPLRPGPGFIEVVKWKPGT